MVENGVSVQKLTNRFDHSPFFHASARKRLISAGSVARLLLTPGSPGPVPLHFGGDRLLLQPSNVQVVRSQGLVVVRAEPRFDIGLAGIQVDGKGDGCHFICYRF